MLVFKDATFLQPPEEGINKGRDVPVAGRDVPGPCSTCNFFHLAPLHLVPGPRPIEVSCLCTAHCPPFAPALCKRAEGDSKASIPEQNQNSEESKGGASQQNSDHEDSLDEEGEHKDDGSLEKKKHSDHENS